MFLFFLCGQIILGGLVAWERAQLGLNSQISFRAPLVCKQPAQSGLRAGPSALANYGRAALELPGSCGRLSPLIFGPRIQKFICFSLPRRAFGGAEKLGP